MNKAWIAVLAGSLLAAHLASLVASAQPSPGLVVAGAWVRALPPTQTNTAAYLTLSNGGAQPVEVVGASAEIAGRVEFHITREVDGFMRMEQLTSLEVAPGKSLALAPGGAHLMLLDLSRMPVPGDTIRLCLRTAQDEQICTAAEVHKGGPGTPSHEHHH